VSDQQSRTVRVRRSPKVGVFLVLGLVVGLLVALVLTVATPDDGKFNSAQVFAYIALIFAPIGAAVFGLVAVVLDRVSVRRARVMTASLETTRGPQAEPDAPDAPAVEPDDGS
jgi:uncharacterized BrkB/YihY/UPF0761 family membrane protein